MPRPRRYGQAFQQTIAASQARTATGNGTGTTTVTRAQVAKVDVTAVTAATATVTVQDSPDGSSWTTRVTFPARSAVGSDIVALPRPMDANVRASWTITGTSITFSVQVASSTGAFL